MIPDQTIEVKVYNQTIKRWRNEGFDCSVGDIIYVPISKIAKTSHYNISIMCDYCGLEFKAKLSDVISNRKRSNVVDKDCCALCQPLKAREVNMKKYGCATPAERPEIIKKMQATTFERYGVTNVSVLPEIKQKKRNTTMSHYGVPYYSMCDEYQIRVQESNFEKYGVRHTLQRPDVREKGAMSYYLRDKIPTSRQQFEMFNTIKSLGYDATLNLPHKGRFFDVAVSIDGIDIDIEFDGYYWHQNTESDADRDKISINDGWRVIRFIGDRHSPNEEQIEQSIRNALAGESRQVISLIEMAS